MRKFFIIFVVLISLFAAGACLAEGELEIQGVSDGEAVLSNQYVDIFTYLDGEKVECEWEFNPSGIARFSSGKKLRLLEIDKAAEVEITARHKASGAEKTIRLFVVPQAKTIHLSLNGETVTGTTVYADMSEGTARLKFESVTSPSGANAAIVWKVSDETVATVDETGLVHVLGMGRCVLSCITVDGKTAEVTISGTYAAKTLEVAAPSELAVGESRSLAYVITPSEAASDGVTWKSSKEKVISVTEDGVLTAKRVGTAVITCTANSGISQEIQIETYLPVETVQIRNSFSLKPGQTEKLSVRVLPKEAKYNTVTFVSLNPDIATVDNEGNVTGVAPGSVTILVTASNGVSAHQTMEVKPVKVESISLVRRFVTMNVGDEVQIEAAFTPENATERNMTYTTDNQDVAVVDENGCVTAVGTGRCIVYCQSERDDIKPLLFRINVQKDGAKPLEGLIIGLNPGHQEKSNSQKLPLAPGSSKTGPANKGGTAGVETKKREYEVTLEISMRLKAHLENLGAEVVMTRTTNDVDLNNIERAQILNEANVDAALQIHLNASEKKSQKGFSVYVKYSDFESFAIGETLLDVATSICGAKKLEVVRSNNYMSLNWSETPALLLECGYMTNPEEDVLLSTPEYQEKLAEGISQGLVAYFAGENRE